MQTDPLFEETAEDIYEHASCSYFSAEPGGLLIKVNQTFLSWTGYERAELIRQKRFEDFLTPGGRIFYQTQLSPLLRIQGFVNEVALEILRKDGTRMPALVNALEKRDARGRLLVIRTTLFNASDRRRYEDELLTARKNAELASNRLSELNTRLVATNAMLHEKRERLRITLNAIGDGVIATDLFGNITYLNPAAVSMTGWTEQDAKGLPLPQVFRLQVDETGEAAPNPLDSVLSEQPVGIGESTTLIQREGTGLAVSGTAAAIRDVGNRLIGMVLVFRDISQMRQMAAKITYQAAHDSLTGLINRREFERRLEFALQSAEVDDKQYSVMYVDLDQFKVVNDTCGHGAGDELLRQIATILQGKLRGSDILARLGGDEFGILLEACASEAALSIANTLLRTVKDFHFSWSNKVFPIGASIGLVTVSGAGHTLADVMRMADTACYVAKDLGRNRVRMYTPDDKELEERRREMGWVDRIQRALNEQRFALYVQKIVALHADAPGDDHYEVLLRMQDVDGGLVPPMAFIPAAERYGLMPQIDRWVIKTALGHYAKRHAQGAQGAQDKREGLYAINLSGATICDVSFLPFLRAEFKRHDVSPERICFEITETAAIANLTQAATLMRELKALGCKITLDDFGSGMSSFGNLKHLPVDYLKIDGGIIKDIVDDPIDFAMVESINRIGHVMGIQTIAEVVEHDAVMNVLREIGVDFAQGNAIQQPVPMSP